MGKSRGERSGVVYIQLPAHIAVACRFTPRTLVTEAIHAQFRSPIEILRYSEHYLTDA